MSNNQSMVITTYINPDTDGIGTALGYIELLNHIGRNDVSYYFFGKINGETRAVIEYLGISLQQPSSFPELDDIILVDTHHPEQLDREVDPIRVIEIIDHHEVGQPKSFPNAKINNEMVGAAATLIVERFQNNEISPSYKTASILLGAIISNTLSFTAPSTKQRDINAASWLNSLTGNKSKLRSVMRSGHTKAFMSDIKKQLFGDVKVMTYGNSTILVGQIELDNLFKLVDEAEIEKIFQQRAKSEEPVSILNCVDPLNKRSIMYFSSEKLFDVMMPSLSADSVGTLKVEAERVMQRKTDIFPILQANADI